MIRNLILRLAARYARQHAAVKFSDGYTSEGIDYRTASRRLLEMIPEGGK